MLTLATLPPLVRALYLRTDDKFQPKLAARLRAIGTLADTRRSAWKRTAGELSRVLAPRYGRGFSAKNLLALYRAYREQGPEALLLGYGRDDDTPAAFITFLAQRVEQNKRVASVELDAIRAEWLTGGAIPGYGTWRDEWRKFDEEPAPDECPEWFIPSGWSPRNLRRKLPGEAEITIARDGFFAAHSLLPQKKNDYSQLRPLEVVVFDDVRTDWLVSYPGVSKLCELWLLVAMDVATRTALDWVSLAAVPDDEGKRAELLEQHMQLLGGALLQRYGIPTAYKMTWLVENAKATLRESASAALTTLSGGQIEVKYTRMVNRALPSGHTERHGTPFDTKGVLESFFRTFHDHTAQLPGQTGARYDLAPAELEAEKKEHVALMKASADLPAEIQEQLRHGVLRYSEAVAALERVFLHLNQRHDHALQGFERIELWRFPEDKAWRSFDELRRYPAAEARRALFEFRTESPLERLERLMRLQPAPTRVPEEALLPFSARTIKKVRHPAPYTIAWREAGTEWIYRGELPELASGKGGPFRVKLLPGDVSTAYLHDAGTGGFLGALRHVPAARYGDEAAQMRAVGEVQHVRSLIVAPVMERHAPARAARDERTALNAAIIESARTGAAMIDGAAQAKAETKKESAAQKQQRARRWEQLAEAQQQSAETE